MPSDQVHWDRAYSGADITQLGWYQDIHEVSLDLISECDGKKIIDVGAGAESSSMTFMASADKVIVVITGEPTSFIDAYTLIKTSFLDITKSI